MATTTVTEQRYGVTASGGVRHVYRSGTRAFCGVLINSPAAEYAAGWKVCARCEYIRRHWA